MSVTEPPQPSLANPCEGDVLAGKYRVESVLGKGGMGVVVAAMHLQLGQRVAIKYLLQPDNTEIVARFLREARAAVRLKSEHVARVLDVGELGSGAPYMVMEYLEGGDLLRHLKTQGPLPIPEAVDYILQTCEAIAEAHAVGIVHRDLKPANLFLTTTPDGSRSVKVLDFGISKVSENESEGGDGMQLTKTEMVLGSPLYMSPEQLKSSKDVDPRSDIWALGVILYQLLAGKVPFNGTAFSELVLKVNLEPPPPLSQYRSDVPAELEALILRCLEKKREHRFNNIAEFALGIAEFGPPTARISAEKAKRVLEATGVSVQAPAPPIRSSTSSSGSMPAVTAATSAARTTHPEASSPPPPTASGDGNTGSSLPTVAVSKSGSDVAGETRSSGKRMGLVVGAVALLGLVSVGGIFLFRGSSENRVESTVTPDNARATPTLEPSARSEPEVKPAAALVNPEAPAPTASAPASAASAAASSQPAATRTLPPVPGTKSSTPEKSSPPPPPTTKSTSKNPLTIGIE
ncbi:serine/threonine-protein kinase [Polyangium sp. y55x31]|uniref:serine/threonine-protein kinase n=1 Tax=Polyangium sp. y55x31 TaxID=3042688 RepID=UPI00248260F3|nr:serine/threonine-protein kinase [Polyangium sp. y55x31]MDI1476537.1 serine/threonine-protein kinase [Polyangium sp. y55x31]